MAENQKYILMIDGAPVEVNREIYIEYHRMDRRDRYLEERDLAHGKTLFTKSCVSAWICFRKGIVS